MFAGRIRIEWDATAPVTRFNPSLDGGFPLLLLLSPRRALQFCQSHHERRDLAAKQGILGLQCCQYRLDANRGRCVISITCVIGQCHRYVDSCRAVTCQ
jgi:hypothetical protein